MGEENIKKMISPFKIIELKSYEQQIDIQKFGEEYNKIKKETKIKNIEEMRSRYNCLNIILTQNKLNDENWIKINNILIKKNKSKIFKNKEINTQIIEDFKKIFGNQINRIINIDRIIGQILDYTKNIPNSNKETLFTPKSKSQDYFRFTQKLLISIIKDNDLIKSIEKYKYILKVLK